MSLPAWTEGKFALRANSTDEVAVCLICWALVSSSDVKMHDKWHQGETYIDPEA